MFGLLLASGVALELTFLLTGGWWMLGTALAGVFLLTGLAVVTVLHLLES